MPFALNNVTTEDTYVDDTELQCALAVQLDIFVANAAVYYSYAIRDPAQGKGLTFSREVYLPPGFHCRPRCADAVRVRSAVAGTPAQVTIEAVLPSELDCG